MAPQTSTVMVMRGLTCHLAIFRACMSGLYLLDCYVWAAMGNRSWQYMNSMNSIMFVGDGAGGLVVDGGA